MGITRSGSQQVVWNWFALCASSPKGLASSKIDDHVWAAEEDSWTILTFKGTSVKTDGENDTLVGSL